MKFVIWMVVALLFLGKVQAQQDSFKVINLNYRSAEDIIPLLQPILDGKAVLTGRGEQLIVRATPAELVEVLKILGRLDTPRLMLLITVRQVTTGEGLTSDDGVLGSTATDFNGGLPLGIGDPQDRGLTKVIGSTERRKNLIQKLQVLDGETAFIETGREVRRIKGAYLGDYAASGLRDRLVGSVGAYYEPVTKGFYVRPRVIGNRVTVEISSNRDMLRSDGDVELQNLATSVSGRLGDWIQIGVSTEGGDRSERDVVYYGQSPNRLNNKVLMRVQVLQPEPEPEPEPELAPQSCPELEQELEACPTLTIRPL